MNDEESRHTLRRNLAALILSKGLSYTALSEKVGVTKQAVAAWVRTGKVAANRLPSIADALGVTIDDLMNPAGSAGEPPTIHAHGLQTVRQRRIPLLDWASLGSTQEEQPGASYVYAPEDIASRHLFAVEVDGDAMADEFPPSTLVYVDTSLDPKPGDLVIAKPEPHATPLFRRINRDGGAIVLLPINPRYSVRPCHQVIGVVVGAYRRIKRE